MNELSMPQFLGVNDMTLRNIRSGQIPEGLGQQLDTSQFAALLETLMNNQFGINRESQAIPTISAMKPSNLQLHELYKTTSLTSFDDENILNNNIEETIINDDNTIKQSASDIVFETGRDNASLIEKMNSAPTIKERLEYAEQIRDKIIDALNKGGYSANDIGKPDKVSIDGELFDVIRSSRRMGRRGAVQFMQVGASQKSDDINNAIFSAGEMNQDVLSGLSTTSSNEDRKDAVTLFRNQILDKLNENGYQAMATNSLDKIVVNGQTFDIIRGMNNTNSSPVFQVLKV